MGIEAQILIGLTVADAAVTRKENREIQRNNEAAERLKQKRADLRSARARTKALRQARIQRAEVAAQATVGEGTGGSGAVGATAGVTQQLTTNLAFMDINKNISTQLSNLNVASSRTSARAAGRRAIFGAGQDITSTYQDIFVEDKPQ
jgi:hypothetical protein